MTIRLFISILLLSIVSTKNLQAQDTLGMSQNVNWLYDTTTFNQTINVNVTVFNTGSLYYGDSIILTAKITSNTPDDTVAMQTNVAALGLPAGDSATFQMNWLVDPLKYTGGGNNITVIWPANSNNDNVVTDSLVLSTYIDTALGISMWLDTEFKIYPNPSKGIIQLEFSKKTEIENVRIYTLDGQLITQFSAQNNYDLSVLPHGAFMIQVMDINGRLSRGKLIIRE